MNKPASPELPAPVAPVAAPAAALPAAGTPITIELVQPATKKSWTDKPIAVAFISAALSLAGVFGTQLYNFNNNEKTSERDDVKIAISLFDKLSSDSIDSRKLAFMTITHLKDRYGNIGTSAADFFDQLYHAADAAIKKQAVSNNAVERNDSAQTQESVLPAKRPDLPDDKTSPVSAGKEIIKSNSSLKSINSDYNSSNKPSIVYIQYYCTSQNAAAASLQTAFRDAGIPAPGIENVLKTTKSPDDRQRRINLALTGHADVRYYWPSDGPAATYSAALLTRIIPDLKAVSIRDLSARKLSVKQGLIEIWLPYTGADCL